MLLDCLMGVFILALAAVSFFDLLTASHKMAARGAQQTKAIQMASRLVENLQMQPSTGLTASKLTSLNLIDSGQNASPYSFNHMAMDDATQYSPAQALPNGTGTLTITNLAGGAVFARVQINWTLESQPHSYTTQTIIGGYR